MKSSEIFLSILFWLILIIDCALILGGNNEYRIYTKTLLIPILLINIYTTSLETKHRRSKALANLDFLFCFLGDFFLLWAAEHTYFVLGLSSFLIAHIFFIIYWMNSSKQHYTNYNSIYDHRNLHTLPCSTLPDKKQEKANITEYKSTCCKKK